MKQLSFAFHCLVHFNLLHTSFVYLKDIFYLFGFLHAYLNCVTV